MKHCIFTYSKIVRSKVIYIQKSIPLYSRFFSNVIICFSRSCFLHNCKSIKRRCRRKLLFLNWKLLYIYLTYKSLGEWREAYYWKDKWFFIIMWQDSYSYCTFWFEINGHKRSIYICMCVTLQNFPLPYNTRNF